MRAQAAEAKTATVLKEMYVATGGDWWTGSFYGRVFKLLGAGHGTNSSDNLLIGWQANSTEPVCTWDGIRCTAQGEVQSIQVIFQNLTGTLPNTLCNLTNLELLSLGPNPATGWVGGGLSGTLPQTLDVDNLMTYSLAQVLEQRGLSGTLPSRMANKAIINLLERLSGTMQAHASTVYICSPEIIGSVSDGTRRYASVAVSGTIPSIWAEESTHARMMTIVGVMISGN